MDIPETRYTKAGDVHIAFQVVGDGPVDLVSVPPAFSHLEVVWEEPSYARFLRRLASFSRLILLDKRGMGMSDRVPGIPTLEERMDDVRAVMDAVGSTRAALYGASEGAAITALYAATHRDVVSALVLFGGAIKDNLFGEETPEVRQALEYYFENQWGSGMSAYIIAPSLADDQSFRTWLGRLERASASPGDMLALTRMNELIDVREALPTITVPTLVLHRSGDVVADVRYGRYAAEHIPGAKFVELSGADHLPVGDDNEAIADEVETFLTGTRPAPEPDRVLSTVLFTDIVGSTQKASQLGDRKWRHLLDRHDELVQGEIGQFRGRLVDTAGDGVLCTFDGPARAVRCACAIRERVRTIGMEVRAGVHTGEIELKGDDVAGIAVHIGARVSALAQPGEVLVSRTVTDLVAGSGLTFVERGEHELKGVPGKWALFAVAS